MELFLTLCFIGCIIVFVGWNSIDWLCDNDFNDCLLFVRYCLVRINPV